jgi:nitrogen regulatory protein PII
MVRGFAAASTGEVGDGKIFVLPVEMNRIRTAEAIGCHDGQR